MKSMRKYLIGGAAALCGLFLMMQPGRSEIVTTVGFKPSSTLLQTEPKDAPFAVVAGGCFWCVESEFRRIEGVLYTVSGYAGSDNPNTTYEQSHSNGSREVVKVYYDADRLSYKELLDFFMTRAHDPTQPDGQGPDIGLPYTSAIFYVDEDQKRIAENLIKEYTDAKRFKNPITTKILPFTVYNDAEEYHQRYYEKYEQKAGQPHMNIWLRQQRENAGMK
jgi:methionine-S-sulfoxide reductase